MCNANNILSNYNALIVFVLTNNNRHVPEKRQCDCQQSITVRNETREQATVLFTDLSFVFAERYYV